MNIELICGKFEDIEIKEKIDLSFLDPPDNEGKKYENYNDKINNLIYCNLLERWIFKACKITSGPVFVSFAEKYIPIVEKIIGNNNLKLIQRLWWYYSFGQAHKNRYSPCCRPIYWLNDNTIYPESIKIPSARQQIYNDKRAKSSGKMPNNIWEFSRICGTFKERRNYHPTQHPEKLLERIILGHSQKGDTVFDAFIGSGTTAIVCQKLDRKCIGIDCSEFYLNKIKENLKND